MHRSTALVLAFAAGVLPCTALAADVQPFLDVETGLIWASRNDVAVPGDTGQRFSIAEGPFKTTSVPFFRVQGGVALGRHRVFATFAPVRLDGHGPRVATVAGGGGGATVVFRGQTFIANSSTSVHYKFDTYRLTYRYALVDRPRLDLQVGATALVRDAEIRLSQGDRSTAEKNVGVVPLLSFRLAVGVAGPIRLSLDGDALAAPQGRAEDVAAAVEVDTGDLTFRAGYRVIEGGADNKSVYNFAWLNHVLVGVRYTP